MRLLCALISFSVLLASCGSRAQEDFQQEGQRIAIALTHELQHIHSREELLSASAKLTRYFEALVDVMIAGRQYHQQHPWEEIPELSREAEQVNVKLQMELARVARFEGGAEVLEKCQEPALDRLDAFQKRLKDDWKQGLK